MHQGSLSGLQSILLKDYLFHHSVICNSVSARAIPLPSRKATSLSRSSDVSVLNRSSLPIPPECRIQYLITYARKNGRRNVWRKSSKDALKFISFIASNLGVLPEPLDFVIREYAGGNGGGAWFRKGFGGNGWSRRGRKLGFIGILLICALGFLLLVSGKEFETGLGLGILGMSVLWFSIRGQNKGLKDCTLGFCVCAAIVILGLRRGELQRWIDGSCVRSSTTEIVARMRRGRRRRTM